jgi:hypothetical protein
VKNSGKTLFGGGRAWRAQREAQRDGEGEIEEGASARRSPEYGQEAFVVFASDRRAALLYVVKKRGRTTTSAISVAVVKAHSEEKLNKFEGIVRKKEGAGEDSKRSEAAR